MLSTITDEAVEAAWHKARNAWMTASRHGTQPQADEAAISVLLDALSPEAAGVTDEMVERARLAFHAYVNSGPVQPDYSDAWRAALEAALPSGVRVMARARVKALEWKVSGLRMLVADSELGQYAISLDPYSAGGSFNLWVAGADEDTSSEYPSLPEAEAAAQADYERRVMSAISSPAPEVSDSPTCQDCNGHNPVWFAPNELWNRVMGGENATDDPGGIVCVQCFIRRAEAAGIIPTAWVLSPEVLPTPDAAKEQLRSIVDRNPEDFADGYGDAAEELEVVAWGMPDRATVYMDGSQPWIARSREFRGAIPLVRQSDALAIIERLRDVIAELEDVVSDLEAERQVIIAAERAAEARLAEAVAKMEGTLAVWDRNTCLHEDTTRGGAIWTICQSCGSKWADDEGGFVPYKDPPEIVTARAFLQSLGKEGGQDEA